MIRVWGQYAFSLKRPWTIVTLQRVQEAIRSFKPYKAPGPDGIYPIMLQKAPKILALELRDIIRECLLTGHVPDAWKKAHVTFIPKIGKDNYDLPKSYRPISLTSFMLKTTEKVIEAHLRDGGYKHFNENQHAYRKGRSTETAIHNLVARIEHSYYNGQVALAIFCLLYTSPSPRDRG